MINESKFLTIKLNREKVNKLSLEALGLYVYILTGGVKYDKFIVRDFAIDLVNSKKIDSIKNAVKLIRELEESELLEEEECI